MPKSKRDKKISLTRTKKKGLESKQKLVEEIRSCIDKYARMCVFTVRNMRNNKLKDVRVEWHHSRFFLGKNKVMALALGRTPEEEIADNLHQVSSRLVGHCGILFTNATKEEMLEYFDNIDSPDFARSGDIAMETVHLPEGALKQFAHSLEPQLRKLGLPTQLIRGVPTLLKDHTVCKKGDVLKPEQAHILKLFGNQMAAFRITVEII
ncbi:ribosomal protein LP0-like [Oratosquilla oratoria]|uniref:ribosomal protein LP0-like n=1 Tax=Oratosquilla oratoria TaxID=337810 RepID=UPI003F772E38